MGVWAMHKLKVLFISIITIGCAGLLTEPAFAQTNLIANPSVEDMTDGQPSHWNTSQWGDNEALLTYKDEGHSGSKSLHIQMSRHVDGDAKWMADPVEVTSGATYQYTSYYKASVQTEIDIQYTHADGRVTYEYIQQMPASSSWRQLNATFTVPPTATKVAVLHIIDTVGWLQTDTFELAATSPAD